MGGGRRSASGPCKHSKGRTIRLRGRFHCLPQGLNAYAQAFAREIAARVDSTTHLTLLRRHPIVNNRSFPCHNSAIAPPNAAKTLQCRVVATFIIDVVLTGKIALAAIYSGLTASVSWCAAISLRSKNDMSSRSSKPAATAASSRASRSTGAGTAKACKSG